MDWYDTLDTPSWTPPQSWFGPVWTVLYAAMAVAAVIVAVRAGFGRELAVFVLQLAALVPYLWVTYAATLHISIAVRN